LVHGDVDSSQRIVLHGNLLPGTRKAWADLGRVEDSFAAAGLKFVLKRPPEREAALRQFLADVQTPGSAEYRHWLTPEQFGQRFGPADSDIVALTSWLESQGLTAGKLSPGRIAFSFSGTAAAVAAALHTEIHRYANSADGGTLLANASEPEIPAAFADLVAGITPMHTSPARSQIAVKGPTSYNAKTHKATPGWTAPAGSGTIYELAPVDFAVQYGLTSVYSAGTTGAGQTIGIVSDSNVDLSMVAAYRSLFSLPAATPTVVVDGDDPGITGDATESYLDLEEAGAVAPGANLVLYTSAGTVLSDGLLTAAMRAVEDNQATVLSVSYATCETALGVGGNAAWASLWQEAAAQGISVFVAAGDAGSAGCDEADSETTAESGLAVNGIASTPYNVAVGGTDFYYSSYASGGSTLATQIGTYWGTTASATPAVSLLQSAPEQVWNDAFGLNAVDGGVYSSSAPTIFAGGGGASAAALQSPTGALTGYAKPAWQTGTGVPADGVRDLPDVALFAGDGSNDVYVPVCALPGDCVTAATGAVTVTSVGGTSVAAPAMAAIQALVNAASSAATSSALGRFGQTAGIYYALAAKYASAAVKPFNDIKTGANQVPCYPGTLNCSLAATAPAKGFYAETGYAAGAGYDRAGGLGSVNGAALIADWQALARKATTTTLTVTPATLTHGTAAKLKVTVAASSGTPTGSAAVTSNSPQAYANGLGAVTLAGATGSLALSDLPGGTYQLTAEYGGDTSFTPSLSAPVSITVAQEKDTLTASGWVINPLDGALYPMTAGMQIPYGSEVYIDAQPVGANEAAAPSTGNAPATGAVAFTDHGGTATRTGTVALNAEGVAEWAPGVGAVGTHAISASYAGDASYASSSTTAAASYTVFKGTTTLYVQPMQTAVVAGGSVTVDVQLFSQYLPLLGSLPTGSVTVTLGGQSKTATWSSSGPAASAIEEAVVTFTSVPAGILPLAASFAGDTNWYGSSTVWGSIRASGTKTVPAVALTASTTSLTPSQSLTLHGTVIGLSTSTTAPTGNLTITWNGGAVSYTGALAATGTNSSADSVTVPGYALTNGTNLLVATYSGDANYAAASSAALAVTLAASDFSLNTTAQQIVVTYPKTGSAAVSLTAINGFSGSVAVSCSAPPGIPCTVANAAVTLSTTATDTITVSLGAGLTAGTWPVEVIATGGGHTHSAQILVAATPQAPAPVFTPPAGAYTSTQLVTITDTAPGAAIYYTTNGTTPTTASTKYTGAISVTATRTIEAIAVVQGYVTSAVSSATYTITPPAATPLISPAGGTFTATQSVTITDATAGATIYYTTNGSTPTTASTKYTAAISVASTETINAVAIASGYSLSAVATAAFTINTAAAAGVPTFTPAGGSYASAQRVTITDATSGAALYYTLNGATPTTASTKYTAAITVSSSETIKAIAVASGLGTSPVGSATYTITLTAATPVISPAAGNYTKAQSVTITDATAGAVIYYTINGSAPTTASAKYAGAFTVSSTETVKAIAVAAGYTQSALATAAYTITSAAVGPSGPHLPGPGSPLPAR
jgi:hypothetical protein